jgi:hypothetical protein
MGLDWVTSMTPYGNAWRSARRLLHAHLHQGVVLKYQPTQIVSARKLAREILIANQDISMLSHILHRNFGRMTMNMVYGIDSEEVANEQLSIVEKLADAIIESFMPGRFLVDFLTFCEYYDFILCIKGFPDLTQ